MAVGAARPAIHRRASGWRRWHNRHGSDVRAPADGYTLLLASTGNTIGTSLYDKLNYNFTRDIAPVAKIADATGVMEVHPSVPARSVPDLISHAKANPAKISMASAGNVTFHSGELFKMNSCTTLRYALY